MNRNNKKLLEKLVEISKGKHVSYNSIDVVITLKVRCRNPSASLRAFELEHSALQAKISQHCD